MPAVYEGSTSLAKECNMRGIVVQEGLYLIHVVSVVVCLGDRGLNSLVVVGIVVVHIGVCRAV